MENCVKFKLMVLIGGGGGTRDLDGRGVCNSPRRM